jgi:hypothetical protein
MTRNWLPVLILGAAFLLASHAVYLRGQTAAKTARPASAAPAHAPANYGAKGDGQADDTDALQKAIDAGTGTIFLQGGTFRITRPLTVDLAKVGFTAIIADGTARLVMDGPGPAIKFIGTHAGTAAPSTVQDAVWQNERMPRVERLEIVGTNDETDGIEASGTMQLTIEDCNIRGVRHAIHLTGRNRNVLIATCHLYNNRGIGVFFDNVNLHQTIINACHISYNGGGGIVTRGGEVRNVQINGCDIEANRAVDGPPTANILFDSTGGSMAEGSIVGCTIQHTGRAKDSANIRILGRGVAKRDGEERPFNCGHICIGSNAMSDAQTNIHLDGVRGATITGNTLWQGFSYNLLVENCSHLVFGSNMLERNPLYGYTSEANNAVVFRNSRDCTLNGLHIHNVLNSEAGLVMDACQRMQVANCSLLDCENAGLLLRNVSGTHVSDCLIRDDRPGVETSVPIRIIGGRVNMIVGNFLQGRPEMDLRSGHIADNFGLDPKLPERE